MSIWATSLCVFGVYLDLITHIPLSFDGGVLLCMSSFMVCCVRKHPVQDGQLRLLG